MAKLATYRAKRDFTKTPEPKGGRLRKGRSASFVIQKHDATRLHYDLRLELDGVYKSWAVTKGPSLIAGEKRLAVAVEDHPLEYGTFEGPIPSGEYGGGTVLLWDRGNWEPEGDAAAGLAKGHLLFRLDGEKLRGGFHLVRMRRRPKERQEQWLLIKSDDEAARDAGAPDILEEAPLSVASGRALDEIAAGRERPKPSRSPRPRTAKEPSRPKAGGKAPPRLPDAIEPCLATLVDAAPTGVGWLHEIKWDGYRLLAFLERGAVRLTSRNGKDWTRSFPGIAQALAGLDATTAILDGEAVVEDGNGVSSFSALQDALSAESGRVARDAIFYAFDLLHRDGQDLRPFPLDERKRQLAELIPPGAALGAARFSEHLDADGPAMIRHACRLGLEGVVSKRRDRPYRSGRGEDWLKTKCTQRQEFVIAGFMPSSAARNAVGSLILGYHEGGTLIHAGRTGTGFTAESSRGLWKLLAPLRAEAAPFAAKLTWLQRRDAVWVRPELVAEVEFRGWTADDHVRHAAFKGLREDKPAREVVREAPTKVEPAPRKRKLAAPASQGVATVAGVTLTHPDRVLWEETGLTKQGLAEFYEEIAGWLLPHVVGRPLALVRCPSGTSEKCFFQKHSWAGLSEFIRRETVRDEDGEEEVLIVEDIRGVVGLVQAGVLEIHPWGSTLDHVDRPDRLVLDFDPGEGIDWPEMIEAAREARSRLEALGLGSFVKTTGGKGLHVVAPLAPRAGWGEVKSFARSLAEAMEADAPDRYTTTSVKRERRGRIFIDYLRNGRGATAVAAYSTRARPNAPVSTPLDWSELSPKRPSNHYTVANLTGRLKRLKRDPWADLFDLEQALPQGPKRSRRRG